MTALSRVLVAAVVALGAFLAPATATAAAPTPALVQLENPIPDIIPGDPLGCDTKPPMSAPNSGLLALDSGPRAWRNGDPFATNPTVTAYEVYGYAGLEWTNFDVGCGPDVARDPEGGIAGSIANMLWSSLLATASVGTAIQRWTYDPNTLDVLEPVQRTAAEALGIRVFMPLAGLTLLAMAGYIFVRSRAGDVREGATLTGWVLLVVTIVMGCILWPAKIAPAADNTIMSVIATVNTAVAGGSSGAAVSIADTNAANVQHGILYSTWASGTFGRSSGETVEKYGPILFKNGALTRSEAALIQTDPERAAEIIEDKKEKFNDAAEALKGEDPIAYEYLAGKQNWSRAMYAAIGWVAYACAMLYQLVASLMLLFSLLIIRLAVMVVPLLAVAALYWPARGVLIRVFDYVVGAVVAAVMFGSVAAIFTAILGGIMSPITNTNIVWATILMFLATVGGFMLTKPWKMAKSFGAPGLSAFRGDAKGAQDAHPAHFTSRRGQAPDGQSPGAPAPADTYTRPATPAATAPQPSFLRDTVGGAVKGAAAGAAFAAATGGASVAAGAAKGAAGAAASGAATKVTGSPTVGAAAGMATARALPSTTVKALPAGPATGTPAPTIRQDIPVADAAPRRVVAGDRVWQPGEANPSAALRPAAADRGAYRIFQPVTMKEATR